jgi:hypothetical protein
MSFAPISSAMFSIHSFPFVERPPASALGGMMIGGARGEPSWFPPPSVYESWIAGCQVSVETEMSKPDADTKRHDSLDLK